MRRKYQYRNRRIGEKNTSILAGDAIRAVDPHSFYADPDPAVFLNADPDPDLDPDPGPGLA